MAVQYYEGIGRRKESTARVRLMGGSGKFMVNEKEAAAYFTRLGDLNDILLAFKACGEEPEQIRRRCDGEGRWHDRPDGRGKAWAGAGAGADQRRLDFSSAQIWFADPRRPCQGTKEAWSQACPQGAHLHQAVVLELS